VREVVWSSAALDDLDETIAYIAQDNPGAAKRILAGIEKAAVSLGIRAIGRRGRVPGTYEKSVTRLPYIIAYALQQLHSGDERIVSLRVVHSARHWPTGEWPD
jgi:toxin ParE1/3/4